MMPHGLMTMTYCARVSSSATSMPFWTYSAYDEPSGTRTPCRLPPEYGPFNTSKHGLDSRSGSDTMNVYHSCAYEMMRLTDGFSVSSFKIPSSTSCQYPNIGTTTAILVCPTLCMNSPTRSGTGAFS